MGWNPFKKKSWEKAGKAIEKTAKQGIDVIEDAGKNGVDCVEDTADKAGKEIENLVKQAEKLGMSIIDDIEKLANKAKREVEGVANKAKNEIEGVGKTAISEIEGAANKAAREVEEGVKSVGHEVEQGVKTAGKEIEDTFEKRIPELIGDAMQELSKLATSQVYKQAAAIARKVRVKLAVLRESKPGLVGYIDDLAFKLQVGPVTLKYGRFYDRSKDLILVLDRLANDPPAFRRTTIIAMLEATGPDSTDLGISVNLAALVVSSEELGAGFALPAIPLALVSELTDLVLKEIGVPE